MAKTDEDAQFLAEQIGSQRAEIETLKQQRDNARDDLNREKWKRKVATRWEMTLITFVVLVLFGAAGSVIYMRVSTPDVPIDCQIGWHTTSTAPTAENPTGGKYTLYGRVPWYRDRRYGEFKTLEGALEAARTLGCKLKTSIVQAR